MTRVGAIDCGTNSIRLLIADVPGVNGADGAGVDGADGAGPLSDVVRLMRVVRLGQGVDATGRLAEDALARTFEAAEEYRGLLRAHGVQHVRFVATSATRDAENREVFTDGIRNLLGVEPEVVSGAEEAALSFAGASSALAFGPADKVLVVDLGGGSTEFVVGTADGVLAALSTDMGCVRFTERYLRSDPPTAEEIAAAEAEVGAYLDRVLAAVPLREVTKIVGVAGSITTITAHALSLPEYLPARIHGCTLESARVQAAAADLLGLTRAERAALPYMHPGRVDVIGAGALIWRTVLGRMAELTGGAAAAATSSEHDILDGIALSLAPAPRRFAPERDSAPEHSGAEPAKRSET